MKIGKSSRSADSADIVGPQLDITKENYFERGKAFVGCRGGGFVVRGVEGVKGSGQSRQPSTQSQWLAWLNYLADVGIPTNFMRANGEATVPCEWPEDFDARCRPSDREAIIYVASRAVDFDRKATIDRVMKRFSAWGEKPKRKDRQVPTEDWLRVHDSPLSVSDELKERMGALGRWSRQLECRAGEPNAGD